jgi:hypothetical protein
MYTGLDEIMLTLKIVETVYYFLQDGLQGCHNVFLVVFNTQEPFKAPDTFHGEYVIPQ